MPSGKPDLGGDAALKTMRFMANELQSIAPPGNLAWDYNEMLTGFQTAQTAQTLMWPGGFANLSDPTKSSVAGRYGMTPPPGGSLLGGNSIGVNAKSKNPEAARLYIAWLTSRAVAKRTAIGGTPPARISLFKDPELVQRYPHYPTVLDGAHRRNVRLHPDEGVRADPHHDVRRGERRLRKAEDARAGDRGFAEEGHAIHDAAGLSALSFSGQLGNTISAARSLLRSEFPSSQQGSDMTQRVIHVGVGSFGQRWCREWLAGNIVDRTIEVVAVVDVRPEAAALGGTILGLPPERCFTDAATAFAEGAGRLLHHRGAAGVS